MKLLVIFSLFGLIALTAHFPKDTDKDHQMIILEGYLNWDVNDQSYILSDVESGEIVYLEFLEEETPLRLDEFNFVEVKGEYRRKSNVLKVDEMRMN